MRDFKLGSSSKHEVKPLMNVFSSETFRIYRNWQFNYYKIRVNIRKRNIGILEPFSVRKQIWTKGRYVHIYKMRNEEIYSDICKKVCRIFELIWHTLPRNELQTESFRLNDNILTQGLFD